MMFGLASFGLAMWSYSFITHDWGADQLLIPQILRGFPQVFAVAPAVNLGLGSLPPERLKYASGLFNMMRNLGGAVGIAVCAAIINDQTNLHFQYIASHLTPANGAMERLVDGLTVRYGSLASSPQPDTRRRSSSSGTSPTGRPNTRLCRRLSRHHDRVCCRDLAGAAAAQGRRAGRRIKQFALKIMTNGKGETR